MECTYLLTRELRGGTQESRDLLREAMDLRIRPTPIMDEGAPPPTKHGKTRASNPKTKSKPEPRLLTAMSTSDTILSTEPVQTCTRTRASTRNSSKNELESK
jgi:hypothetical protein